MVKLSTEQERQWKHEKAADQIAPRPLDTLVWADVAENDNVHATMLGLKPGGRGFLEGEDKFSVQNFETTRVRLASGAQSEGEDQACHGQFLGGMVDEYRQSLSATVR